MSDYSPERIAAVWDSLERLAGRIEDEETRVRYLADWRGKYEEAFPRWLHADDIVRLPDWKHVGEISEQERRQAELVSAAWVASQAPDPMNPEAVKRFAWEMGRRAGAQMLDRLLAEQIVHDKLGSAATSRNAMREFARGLTSDAGEGLLAAIVLDLRCSRHPLSELGLTMRFRDRHGHDFRHTTAKGWMQYDGKRWKELAEERGALPAEVLAAMFDTIAAIQREATAMAATGLRRGSIPEAADPEKLKVETPGGKVLVGELEDGPLGLDSLMMTATTCRLASLALARFGRACEERKRVVNAADLARRWLTVRFQDFDTDPLTINCQNGTLRLVRHVEDGVVRVEAVLSEHRREDLLTRIAAVPYDADAPCPNYDETIAWAQPKADMRRYLHQWGGYNLTGDMGAQIFHIWWGPTAQNGKSTILDAWADAAGDYGAAGKIETFMEAAQAKSGDAATPALAALPGVRMLRTGEPPSGAKFDESLINQITGQDTLQVRDNFRSFFPVKLQLKVTVACNSPPAIPNATEGIKRRVKVVPFEQSMKTAVNPDGTPKKDPNFKAKLVAEMPGIFARLVEGALDWLRHGFIEPGDVTAWTEEYKDENDPLGRFLSYCTEVDPASRIQASKLHELFGAWSKATGGPEWSIAHFKKKMIAKGHSSKQSNGMQWIGLRAIRHVADFVDAQGNVRDLSSSDDGDGAPDPARISDPPPSASLPATWNFDDDLLGD